MSIADLSLARTVAEMHMVDRCRITRDIEGSLDDTLDPTTLRYVRPANDASTIYEGKCLLGRPRQQPRRSDEGGQAVLRQYPVLRIPIASDPLQVGDVVEMLAPTDAKGNPDLEGRRLRVVDAHANSIAASRIAMVEDETGARAR